MTDKDLKCRLLSGNEALAYFDDVAPKFPVLGHADRCADDNFLTLLKIDNPVSIAKISIMQAQIGLEYLETSVDERNNGYAKLLVGEIFNLAADRGADYEGRPSVFTDGFTSDGVKWLLKALRKAQSNYPDVKLDHVQYC